MHAASSPSMWIRDDRIVQFIGVALLLRTVKININ